MLRSKSLSLCGFILFAVALASASSASQIAITGTAYDGGAITEGDFRIQGNGLDLSQGLPGGPSFISTCTVGTTCTLIWSPVPGSSFCTYCSTISGGTLGLQTAEYLDPELTFKGSAFYSGQDTLTMNITVTGTITGYELVGCNSDGGDCSLGPQVFSVHISAKGTEVLNINTGGIEDGTVNVIDANATFSGLATTTTPEPASMVLVGTGLAGIWIRKRARGKQVTVG